MPLPWVPRWGRRLGGTSAEWAETRRGTTAGDPAWEVELADREGASDAWRRMAQEQEVQDGEGGEMASWGLDGYARRKKIRNALPLRGGLEVLGSDHRQIWSCE